MNGRPILKKTFSPLILGVLLVGCGAHKAIEPYAAPSPVTTMVVPLQEVARSPVRINPEDHAKSVLLPAPDVPSEEATVLGDKTTSLKGNQTTRTLEVQGGSLDIRGDGNNLTIEGTTQVLSIIGSKNFISVSNVKVINIRGSGNLVGWLGSQPLINQFGPDNEILAGSQ
jgi:hypothetical protein